MSYTIIGRYEERGGLGRKQKIKRKGKQIR